ncbi:MAG TPA: HD domain-containing protein [Baekduia sp.]|nr:HD domain-containing protein [Baekduia sp.]
MFVRDFQDGQDLDLVLLVREVQRRAKRDGSAFLNVVFGDRTGSVAAKIWDGIDEHVELCVAGSPLHVEGRYTVDPKWGAEIRLRSVSRPVPNTFDERRLVDGSSRTAAQMEADLRALIDTIHNRYLVALLEAILGPETETYAQYRCAPAAKRYHQAYAHGLLEHSLTVAQSVSAISATFPGIDREIAVTGALLHDIGKLEAYTSTPPVFDMTDAGRLQGEIALGYFLVRRAIEDLDGFPADLAQAVTHIILSHHGSLEHGSPVVPCTREAMLVHMIDNLGGRLGSFDRLEKELAPGAEWSAFDKALGTGAYFASTRVEPAQLAA